MSRAAAGAQSALRAQDPGPAEEAPTLVIDLACEIGRVEFVSGFAIPFTAGSLARVVLDDGNEDRLRRAVTPGHHPRQ